MEQVEYNIIDNVIYTPDVSSKPDPKGVGHFYYTKMSQHKNKIAQIDGYTKEEETFASLLQRSVRTALTMIDNGIKPGDHISMCTYNHLSSVVPHIASYFTGSIMGAIEPTMSVDGAVYLLQQTLPKIIFATPSAVELVEKVVERIGTNTMIVVFGETSNHTPFSQFISPHQDETKFKPVEVGDLTTTALIFFSSGTTGMPKGICHSHLSMLYLSGGIHLKSDHVLYSIANPYWSVSPIFLHLSVEYGNTRVVYPSYKTDEPWAMFYQHVDFGFLNALQALHMVRSKKPDNINLKNVKNLQVGGNPLTLGQLHEIKSVLSQTQVSFGYSQSEIFKLCFTPLTPGTELQKRNELSVGTIAKGHSYKIVDVETGKVLGPNQVGELRLQTLNKLTGYFNRDSSESFDSDGWLRTGDLFYYSEDLCFYVADRIKETFKYHIFHVSPAEIERVILELEPIESAIVIGIPHETEVNHAMAVVKLKPKAREVSGQEIMKHVEGKLENTKWLRGGVKFVDSYPMTVSGKVNRFKLTKLILEGKTT